MGRIKLKSEADLKLMRPACVIAAQVLEGMLSVIKPGLTTRELDEHGATLISGYGAKSAFLGYRKYPCHTCLSVNEEIVHGLASDRELRFGDIISVDVGVLYKGFIGDNARTMAVGGCGLPAQRLMEVTETSLHRGIAAAQAGNRVTDISRAVQEYVEGHGFSLVREFVGHGVGRSMHEEPQVPNFVDPKSNDVLVPGMTIAIEPMVNAGRPDIKILKDGWTVITQDGSLSAHFEHTVLITGDGPEILTCTTPSR